MRIYVDVLYTKMKPVGSLIYPLIYIVIRRTDVKQLCYKAVSRIESFLYASYLLWIEYLGGFPLENSASINQNAKILHLNFLPRPS